MIIHTVTLLLFLYAILPHLSAIQPVLNRLGCGRFRLYPSIEMRLNLAQRSVISFTANLSLPYRTSFC